MLRTWDSRRAGRAGWDAHGEADRDESLAPWLRRVDLLLYAALAGLIGCLVLIVIG